MERIIIAFIVVWPWQQLKRIIGGGRREEVGEDRSCTDARTVCTYVRGRRRGSSRLMITRPLLSFSCVGGLVWWRWMDAVDFVVPRPDRLGLGGGVLAAVSRVDYCTY